MPKRAIAHDQAAIVGAEAHHVRSVLRLGVGDELLATDGLGCDYLLKILRVSPDAIVCDVLGTVQPQTPETRNRIVLMQCCLSSGKMDQVMDRATQLGASRLVPVASEKSKFRGDDSRFRKKVERWSRIASAAALQSGRAVFPPVEPVTPFVRAVEAPSQNGRKLMLSLHAESKPAHEVLPELLSDLGKDDSVYLLVGPEAGFSEVERTAAMRRDFVPVRMGRRTLRAETAPIIALALVLYYLDEL
jgi:16S rRNA (uracil1498-N3)-methyltransferase